MADRDITLWLDERWYAALEEHFPGSVQEQMEELLDERINRLPQEVYERISREIWQEDQQRKQDKEAGRRFAVFRIRERGEQHCCLVDEPIDFVIAARSLRSYTCSESGYGFRSYYAAAQEISAREFAQYMKERFENTGRVVGLFDVDLDRGSVAVIDMQRTWHAYAIHDVSTGIYYADRRSYEPHEARLGILLDHLCGKELPEQSGFLTCGTRELRPEEVSFADEITEMDGKLNFYMASFGGLDEVLGTQVCTAESDDYVNIYADYDLEHGEVADSLSVILCRGDGTDIDYEYPLSPEEKAMLLPKMEAYCQQQTGMSLADYREQYLTEQRQEQGGSPPMAMGQTM